MRLLTKLSVRALPIAFLVMVGPVAGQPSSRDDTLVTVRAWIGEIRSNSYTPSREASAQGMASSIRTMKGLGIDATTIDDIASLLGDNSDVVRGWAAMSLALIGPTAKRTAPALEKAFLLAKDHMLAVQNQNFANSGLPIFTGSTSADDICYAFQKIEVTSPLGCRDGHYEP